MKTNRREFLAATVVASALAMAPKTSTETPAWGEARLFALEKVSPTPVTIASVELLKSGGTYFVRSTSTDGAVGVCVREFVEEEEERGQNPGRH
jgi:hypothetical protein